MMLMKSLASKFKKESNQVGYENIYIYRHTYDGSIHLVQNKEGGPLSKLAFMKSSAVKFSLGIDKDKVHTMHGQ